MKSILPVILLFFIATSSFGQQLNTTSFYQLYSVLHNPATAGNKGHAEVGGSFKTQWSNMPGSPRTALAFGQMYFEKARIGLGGYLYNDATGPTSRTGMQVAYAYHIPLKEKTYLSFGLEGRLQQLQFDREKLLADLGSIDPVATGASNRLKADAGFGMSVASPGFQLGAAVSQLVETNYQLYNTDTSESEGKLYRHYYLHGNINWAIDEETKLIPNFLFTYLPNAPLEAQFGVVIKNPVVWFGMSWRAKQSWMISAGVTVKQRFGIGYSFDIYSTPLSVFIKGSSGHELFLHYEFLKKAN